MDGDPTPALPARRRTSPTSAGPGLLQSAAAIRGSLNPAGLHLSQRKLLFRQTEPPLWPVIRAPVHYWFPYLSSCARTAYASPLGRGTLRMRQAGPQSSGPSGGLDQPQARLEVRQEKLVMPSG